MQTTGTDDISRATRRGVGALQGAAYTGGGFGVGAPLGNRVKQSLAGDGFKAKRSRRTTSHISASWRWKRWMAFASTHTQVPRP
jgi:hypothetical protein